MDLSQRKIGAWQADEGRRFAVTTGDVLFVRGSGSKRQVGQAAAVGSIADEVAFPDTLIRGRLRQDLIDLRYFVHAWNSPLSRQSLEKVARTTAGIYKVNQKDLALTRFPLPSLDEQRRIVAVLEDHLSRLDAADAYLTASVVRARRLAAEALTFELSTAGGAALPPPAEGVDDSGLPPLPRSWSWARLEAVADVVGGVTKDAKKQSDPSYAEVPYLRVANVQKGRLDLASVTRIRVPQARAEQLRLRRGDVLLNEGGDRDKLGRGWVWDEQIADCIHQNHVFRARIRDDALVPELLSHAANTIGGRWCERNGTQSVNLASISLRKIKLMPVPVPPRSQQPAIARRVADHQQVAQRLISAVHAAEQRSTALRRALLTAAFTGRLTGRSSDLDVAEELAEAAS